MLHRRNYHKVENGLDANILRREDADTYYEREAIPLLTLHAVKGLEFPVVFVVGINEGILPVSEEKEEEERKLLYVGMTRARKQLYMSSSGSSLRTQRVRWFYIRVMCAMRIFIFLIRTFL